MGLPLFKNLPSEDPFDLFQEGAVPDVERTAKYLKLTTDDIAKAARIPINSVRFDSKMPAALEARAREWAIALNLVGSFLKDPKKTLLWFSIPNPLLGGATPRDMIVRGRASKLIEVIQQALGENG